LPRDAALCIDTQATDIQADKYREDPIAIPVGSMSIFGSPSRRLANGRGLYRRGCVNRLSDYDPKMVPEVLAAIGARPPRAHLVVLSDFDGTLASFDVDPSVPHLSGETRHALEALASHDNVTVGLVS